MKKNTSDLNLGIPDYLKQAIIYFEQIYNLIIGGIYDINDLLSSAKDFLSNSENNLNSKNFLIKKKVK